MNSPNTLRTGDRGADVTVLQTRLVRADYRVSTDGWFGPATETAVRAFQRDHAQVVDGIAGPRTQAALQGQTDPLALTQNNIITAATSLDCEPAAINAVIEVESPRGGFLPDGRVVILFERHIFWQQLVAAGIDPTTANLPESILSQQRGGYVGGAAEYARLAQAAAVHKEAAHAACSWGRFQIMGYHATALGYASAVAMAVAFANGESAHLAAFVSFVELDPDLLKALRARKWAAFAKIYNGSAYDTNLYDTKLASAYARHSAALSVTTEAA
jgi:N-acetylmuramidase/Putative peptidoglycan binding domain